MTIQTDAIAISTSASDTSKVEFSTYRMSMNDVSMLIKQNNGWARLSFRLPQSRAHTMALRREASQVGKTDEL